MLTADFDYILPPDLIAQHPAPDRTASCLLVVDRQTDGLEATTFSRLPSFLRPGDLLVVNDSRVFPARLMGSRPGGGARVEILLLEPDPRGGWWAMLRPGKRLRPGARVVMDASGDVPVEIEIVEKSPDGRGRIRFVNDIDPVEFAEAHGQMPLPPYIQREHPETLDRDRYQTVYSREPGSVAAPTAGLHFSTGMLAALAEAGVERCQVTLHVGTGTFAPVKAEHVEDHAMHEERYSVPDATADAILRARAEGRRVIAVGTTSLRVLESVAREHGGEVVGCSGRTRLFLRPPADFLVVNALLTNFHLPRSTLLMLVCAFASPGRAEGRERILNAYRVAMEARFRFYSYGDAMLLI